jgi:hypothetical protein
MGVSRWSLSEILGVAAVIAVVTAAAGCDEPEPTLALDEEGPPMIRQVLLSEGTSRVLAFGDHPDAAEGMAHPSTVARAGRGQSVRVVIDELLLGNGLEEIRCANTVDEDEHARIPYGATPDDVERCSQPRDLLPTTCPADDPQSMCIGPSGPVGVYVDGNGRIDLRFIERAARFRCGDHLIAVDLDISYWQPSGTQLVPASTAGLDALGPAIVMRPRDGLPRGTACTLDFAADVMDKDGNALCAPAGGDPAAGCTPGDTSAVTFTTEPTFRLLSSVPASGAVGVGRNPVTIVLQFSAVMDLGSLAGDIVIEENGVVTEAFTVSEATTAGDSVGYRFVRAGAAAPSTTFRVTIPPTVRTVYGDRLGGDPIVITFTTVAT